MPYPCVVAHCLVTFPVSCPIQFPIVHFLSHFLAKFQQTRKRPDLGEAGPHRLGVGRPEEEAGSPGPQLRFCAALAGTLGKALNPGFLICSIKG